LKIRLRSQPRIGVPAEENPDTRSYFEFCDKRLRNNFAIANFPNLTASGSGALPPPRWELLVGEAIQANYPLPDRGCQEDAPTSESRRRLVCSHDSCSAPLLWRSVQFACCAI